MSRGQAAESLVVGQDWGDIRYFTLQKGFDGPSNPTNVTLQRLLGSVGIEIPFPIEGEVEGKLFFTNAVLCLKEGGLQAPVVSE